MKKAILILLLSFSIFTFDIQGANAQDRLLDKFTDVLVNSKTPLNGFENSDHNKVGLLIHLAIDNPADPMPGLTDEILRTQCELCLR